MADKFNIETHKLVPKHTKLAVEEAQKVLEQFNVSPRQLPKILKTDPAIKNMDANPGDIIKIERASPVVGKTHFYRVVVNA